MWCTGIWVLSEYEHRHIYSPHGGIVKEGETANIIFLRLSKLIEVCTCKRVEKSLWEKSMIEVDASTEAGPISVGVVPVAKSAIAEMELHAKAEHATM